MTGNQMNVLNASRLHQLWSAIEKTNISRLLGFNDTDLIQHLLQQLETQEALSSEEIHTVSNYVFSKKLLIRELALERGQNG
jgi:succinate dehydrogenase flavin-adding protein (antitoxin of CptAB toxin-antitoxin module)